MRDAIFVFGSNLAGKHGKGAALWAKQNKGAKQGKGFGLSGASYAIPTKDENLNTLPIDKIDKYVGAFCEFARMHPLQCFELTPVGTGLAGLPKKEIAALFKKHELPTKRLSLDMPESVHTRFKTACSATGRKMVSEMQGFIEQRIKELEAEAGITRK